jgi:2Fe-2S ferredoxin
MPKMTFVYADGSRREVDAPLGLSVLEIAHRNDIDIEGACEGSLACSTCHIIVDDGWYDKLPEASEDEEDMLDLAAARRDAEHAARVSLPQRVCRAALVSAIPAGQEIKPDSPW